MIYTASLNVPVKKALGKQAMQSNLNRICDQIGLDPDTTNMDVVILGPKDLIGPKAAKVQKAINGGHPDVCVIYIYEKDSERDLIECEYKKQCKKIRAQEITETFEEFVGQHKVRQGKQQVTSADFKVITDPVPEEGLGVYGKAGMPGDDEVPVRVPVPTPVVEEPAEPEPNELDELPEIDTTEYTEVPKIPLETEFLTKPEVEAVPTPPSISAEEMLSNMRNYEDWALLKERLNHDSIIKSLIAENSEYVGLINMLDVMDKRIETVWRDAALSADQKFEKIKEIGLERAVVRATTNSINVEKAI